MRGTSKNSADNIQLTVSMEWINNNLYTGSLTSGRRRVAPGSRQPFCIEMIRLKLTETSATNTVW